MSNHLKRFFAPKSWKIKRKGIKFVAKPRPGSHVIGLSMPLNVVVRDMLGYAKDNKEVKYILEKKNVTIDGRIKKDYRFPVGLFDVLSFNDIDESFRVILDRKGKISLVKISREESKLKIYRVIGKSMLKGKKGLQLNLSNGENLFVKNSEIKVGDSVLISLEKNHEIKEQIALDKGAIIFLTGGKHIGEIGKVQDIKGKKIVYTTEDGKEFETLIDYAFAIGKDKPLINL